MRLQPSSARDMYVVVALWLYGNQRHRYRSVSELVLRRYSSISIISPLYCISKEANTVQNGVVQVASSIVLASTIYDA
jgi:hypothetical protein